MSSPRVVDLRLHPDRADEAGVRDAVALALDVDPGTLGALRTVRRGIDARHGRVSIALQIEIWPEAPPAPVVPALPTLAGAARVLVVGGGPAGLFAAWGLARRGIRTILLERGPPVPQRRRDVARLNREGRVDPESNYCFGEGGAGTFSDGKLYTRAGKRGPVRQVLGILAACGAPPSILYDARPHIGTNRLPQVVIRLRERLEAAGVVFRFGACVEDLLLDGRRVGGVRLRGGERLEAPAVVLATGHSARDVYRRLHQLEVALEAKPFAVGVRVEHPQALIDRIQYGELAGHPQLGPAPYSLRCETGGRRVYSFCMCPGGFTVAATTQAGRVVLNGMSPRARGARWASSGLVIGVGPADFGEGVLGGLALQDDLERAAFEAGGGGLRAPAQRLTDFVAGRPSATLPDASYRLGLTAANLAALLPRDLAGPLADALAFFEGRRMRGYLTEEAVMLGVETRTSAPLRVLRDPATLESVSHPGLYPVGEGAGYAGGIVSAALDGLRLAERLP